MNTGTWKRCRGIGLLMLCALTLPAGQGKADDPPAKDAAQLPFISQGIGAYLRQFSKVPLEFDSEKPTGIKKLPSGLLAPRFGKIKLGPKESSTRFYVVLDAPKDKPPRLYIDSNGNGDLTDDPDPGWQRRTDTPLEAYAGEATLDVSYGKEVLPLKVKLTYTAGKFFEYYRDYCRAGEITLGVKKIKALLADELTSGDFRSGATSSNRGTLLMLDLNGDGQFDRRQEAFPIEHPFNVDGTNYEITDMNASGSFFRIIKSENSVAHQVKK